MIAKPHKGLVACALEGVCSSGLFSLIFYFGQWQIIALFTAAGFFGGLVLAPRDILPKLLNHPGFFQASCGSIAGTLVGVAVFQTLKGGVDGLVVGAITGWMFPWWGVKLDDLQSDD